MSTLAVARIGKITIPNGTAVSNVIKARECYEDAEEILLEGPAALDAHTYVLEVTDDADAIFGATVWRAFQSGSPAADVAPPAAAKSIAYASGLLSADAFRIRDTSGNVAADRIWIATKQYRVN